VVHDFLLKLTAILAATILPVVAAEPYPLFYGSPTLFLRAIGRAEADIRPLGQPVTGVTVPHHLLAADLIAGTLRLASGHHYDRIVILSPDHFHRGTTLCSTTTRAFQSPLGDVAIDLPAVRSLLDNKIVSESSLFSHEHGIQAILPFLARWFPDTPIIPLALDTRSRPADWPALAAAIRPVVTPHTLVIQSTDFSHYLSQPDAAGKDQQTLMLLATGDANGIAGLSQPANLDSKASQWVQMTLQRQVFGCAAPVVVDNRNAIRYGGRPDEPRTTSYIPQVYSPGFIPAAALPGEAWYFGGDTQFGRHVADLFADPARAARVRDAILSVTGSRPLVVNLEGVLLDGPPSTDRHPMRIGMNAALAIRELHQLHVAAVSVANNHTLDFGAEAREHMIRALAQNGISVAAGGAPADLGRFRLAAATDVVNLPEPRHAILGESSFDNWRQATSGKPLFAFLHCGTEYADSPGARERQLADWAENAGASLVIGCHPHRPSPAWERTGKSLRFSSMGNLIFDQTDPHNTGGLIEIRFFEQGTWAARWIPLGNLFAGS
jgi:poly-gamma-glutamate synthesis protein (capsule biosynthesis protein)